MKSNIAVLHSKVTDYRQTSEFMAGAIKKTILSNMMTEQLSKSL